MELGASNKDHLLHDCMNAGGRVTQEQLPRDEAVKRPGMANSASLFDSPGSMTGLPVIYLITTIVRF